MNICTSVFVYVGSIGLYKRIVNADTQSIRICKCGWTGDFETFACVFSQTPSPFRVLPLIQEGEFFSLLFSILLKLLLLDKRRWIQKLVFEDGGVRMFCLCIRSNSLPHLVLSALKSLKGGNCIA